MNMPIHTAVGKPCDRNVPYEWINRKQTASSRALVLGARRKTRAFVSQTPRPRRGLGAGESG
jgi:hypothetical protein